MFNADFYPTPSSIIVRMWSKLDANRCSYILEPSAGRGDIIDWIKKRYIHHEVLRCDAIESDPELQMILRGKGYNLIHNDFLTFRPSRMYDGILMNPPFSTGAKHLLKAWEILQEGVIVCLLNQETIKNKCNKERILLGQIIEQHGEYEDLGDCFKMADRKTNVGVYMVTLRKESKKGTFDFFTDMATNKECSSDTFDMEFSSVTDLATPDLVDNLERMYWNALEAHRDLLRAKNRVMFYAKPLSRDYISRDKLLGSFTSDIEQYNDFVDTLNEQCWETVFSKTNLHKFITRGIRDEFNKFKNSSKRIDFTAANIRTMVQTLGMSMNTIMEKAIVDVFNNLTRYDKKNTIHVEGWKTNDAWRVNRKVIIPYVVEVRYNGGPGLSWSRDHDSIDDIDRVMCTLSGKDFSKILSITKALQESFKKDDWKDPCESEFFKIKFYKKGTIHLEFKDEELLNKFNMAAAKGKNWLPGDR